MTSVSNPKPNRLSAPLLFLLGFGLFMFTRRSEILPSIQEMIVIAPIFILGFSRSLPPRRAMMLTTLGFVLSMNLALWGLFDVSDPLAGLAFNVIRSTLLALLYAMPYLIDRWLYARFGPSLWSILAFPVVVTAMMFLSSIEGPFDGVSAKTAFALGTDSLRQLYALTGLWGFIFLWSLPAALIDHVWRRKFATVPSIAATLVFASILAGLSVYGANRLATPAPDDTVRIAAVVLLPEDGVTVSMEPFFVEKRVLPYDETMARIARATADAMAAGAQIVAFQEHLLTVMEPDVAQVQADYQRIAAENAVWLSLTYSWYATSADEKGNNVHLLIDDQGKIRIHYDKRFLWGWGSAGEPLVFNKGAEVIQSVATPYGRIAISVCRDMTFPAFARQAGQAGADIMVVPSYDFPKSNGPSDNERTIENGFTMIRPTYNGVSFAADPYGRILAQMDSADGGSGIMLADVATRGVNTLYARWGDWFGWLNVALLIGLSGAARLRSAFHARDV